MRLLLSLFLLLPLTALSAELSGRVVGVTDGDTVKVLDADNQVHEMRLAGIDAPERRQPWGTRAKQAMADLVTGQAVRVDWHKRDRWKRIIGAVYVDGQDAGLALLRSGLAWHFKRYPGEQAPQQALP